MKLKVIELHFDGLEDEDKKLTVAIVKEPAIKVDFFAFSENKQFYFYNDDEKMVVCGPIMIPNKLITRNDKRGKYVCYWSCETIQKFKEYLLRDGNLYSNINHDGKIRDAHLVEIWTKDFEQDKSTNYGFGELPIGTLFAMYKINDLKTWEDIKSGKLNGFSIEGWFETRDTGKTVDSSQLIRQQFEDYDSLSVDSKEVINKIVDLKISRPVLFDAIMSNKENKKLLFQVVKEKMQSYSDYPEYISQAAQRGIKLNDKLGNKCATQVGKIRAQQLANREPISLETIKRMKSYLSRAMTYYNPNDNEACGTISVLLWGGPDALNWADNKLKQIEAEKFSFIIQPNAGENEQEFIDRCMIIETENYDRDQAYAICKSKWENKK